MSDKMPICDATLCGLPVSACSSDRVKVWHGMDTPAISCGRHAAGSPVELLPVFRGHRVREGVARPWTEADVITEQRA